MFQASRNLWYYCVVRPPELASGVLLIEFVFHYNNFLKDLNLQKTCCAKPTKVRNDRKMLYTILSRSWCVVLSNKWLSVTVCPMGMNRFLSKGQFYVIFIVCIDVLVHVIHAVLIWPWLLLCLAKENIIWGTIPTLCEVQQIIPFCQKTKKTIIVYKVFLFFHVLWHIILLLQI